MSEELGIIIVIMNHWIFKTVAGTTVTSLIGWVLISIRNTTKKIKDAPTIEDLECVKKESFSYTDSQLKIHEDKQILELTTIAGQISDTHKMVTKLLDIHLNNKS